MTKNPNLKKIFFFVCVFFVSLAGWGGGGGRGVVFVHDFFGGKGRVSVRTLTNVKMALLLFNENNCAKLF